MATVSLKRGKPMTAILTCTSQTVELQIVDSNRDTVETSYWDTESQAMQRANEYNIVDVEFEQLDI